MGLWKWATTYDTSGLSPIGKKMEAGLISGFKTGGGALKTGLKTGAKWGAIAIGGTALLTAGAVAVSGIRSRRAYNEDDNMPIPASLSDKLPDVLEFTPPEEMVEQQQPAGRKVVGPHTARYLGQTNGGPNVEAPSLMRPDGSNAVDGSRAAMVDLNAPAGAGGRGM